MAEQTQSNNVVQNAQLLEFLELVARGEYRPIFIDTKTQFTPEMQVKAKALMNAAFPPNGGEKIVTEGEVVGPRFFMPPDVYIPSKMIDLAVDMAGSVSNVRLHLAKSGQKLSDAVPELIGEGKVFKDADEANTFLDSFLKLYSKPGAVMGARELHHGLMRKIDQHPDFFENVDAKTGEYKPYYHLRPSELLKNNFVVLNDHRMQEIKELVDEVGYGYRILGWNPKNNPIVGRADAQGFAKPYENVRDEAIRNMTDEEADKFFENEVTRATVVYWSQRVYDRNKIEYEVVDGKSVPKVRNGQVTAQTMDKDSFDRTVDAGKSMGLKPLDPRIDRDGIKKDGKLIINAVELGTYADRLATAANFLSGEDFKKTDTNKDGLVSIDELHEAAIRGYNNPTFKFVEERTAKAIAERIQKEGKKPEPEQTVEVGAPLPTGASGKAAAKSP